ncbi:MAG: outer membrane lipoprotein-sorting protein [Sulfurimonas sp.]|nr:outer membrane lipoprotein-sorting protein [Sulfurimonas sp.]
MIKILGSILFLGSTIFALSNFEVAQKSEEVMTGFKDSIATMQMTLINAKGQEKIRTMKMQVLEGKVEDKSLMEFLTPPDVKGTKFLSYEHIDIDDDQWLYLPALKRVKRIASKNKSGSFMGSEFSYEDLGSFNFKKYSYTGEAEEVIINEIPMYKISYVPISKYSGYTKQISWINKKDFLVHKVEYYDRKKKLLKTAYFSDYKYFDGIPRIGSIVMKNIQNDKTTKLVWIDEKIKNSLKDKNFHKRYLKK